MKKYQFLLLDAGPIIKLFELGISLQEVLDNIGLSKSSLEWEYTKSFREIWTHKGQADSIQDKGVR